MGLSSSRLCGCMLLILSSSAHRIMAAPSPWSRDPEAHTSLNPLFDRTPPPSTGVSSSSDNTDQLLGNGFTNGTVANGSFMKPPPLWKLNETVLIEKNALPNWYTRGRAEYTFNGWQPAIAVPRGYHAVRLLDGASILQVVEGMNTSSVYCLSYGVSRNCPRNETQTWFSSNAPDMYALAFRPETSVLDLMFRDHPNCTPLIYAVALEEQMPLSNDDMSGNLVKNSGFEVGPYFPANWSSGVVIRPNTTDTMVSPLPGWTTHPSKGVRFVDSAHFHVPQGNSAVMLADHNEGSAIYVHVPTIPGKQYNATFVVGNSLSSCRGSMEVEASTGKWSTKVVLLTSTGKIETVIGSLSFYEAAGATTTLVFSGSFNHTGDDKGASTLCGPLLDDVRVYQVNP